MYTIELSAHIDAPVEKAYDYLSDLRKHGEWSSSVTRIELVTDEPIGVGSEFRASETIPARFYSYARLTALEPPRRIAWVSTDRRFLRTEWEFELSPEDGGTHLVQRARFEGIYWLGPLVLNLWRKPKIPAENRRSLERIKAILER